MTVQLLRTRAVDSCRLCGGAGAAWRAGLRDGVCGVPGEWRFDRCVRCGFIWLNPTLVEEDIPNAYVGYHTHGSSRARRGGALAAAQRALDVVGQAWLHARFGYPRPPRAWTWPLAYLLPLVRDAYAGAVMHLPAQPGRRLLDVGCGDGGFLAEMQGRGWVVKGLEPDPAAAERAAERLGRPVRQGTLDTVRYPDATFDAVTLAHVVEHVPDPVKLLAESHRILRPGGTLVLTTPNAESWGARLFGKHWRGLEPPRHLHLFTRRTLAEVARRAGFPEPDLRPTVRSGYVLGASWLLRRGRAFEGGSPRFRLPELGLATLVSAIESAVATVRPSVSEEITLVAQRG